MSADNPRLAITQLVNTDGNNLPEIDCAGEQVYIPLALQLLEVVAGEHAIRAQEQKSRQVLSNGSAHMVTTVGSKDDKSAVAEFIAEQNRSIIELAHERNFGPLNMYAVTALQWLTSPTIPRQLKEVMMTRDMGKDSSITNEQMALFWVGVINECRCLTTSF
jgi:hypothetical protein